MKKLFLAAACAVVLAACDDGGIFDPDTPDIQGQKVARLQATGFDLRVYEFTPQSDGTMTCVFVAGDSKAGLDCFTQTPQPQE